MPGPSHVRNSDLNKHTYELIRRRVIKPLTADSVADEYENIVKKFDELKTELAPILDKLRSIIKSYAQERAQYANKRHSDEQKSILNQAANTAMQSIKQQITPLTHKIVGFIEYAINVPTKDQGESDLYNLKFKIHRYLRAFQDCSYEYFTQDKKYHSQHVNAVALDIKVLCYLAETLRDIENLVTKINQEQPRQQGFGFMLFMFKKPDAPFVKLDKAIPSLNKLFTKCNIEENPTLKKYRAAMIKFSDSIKSGANNKIIVRPNGPGV